MPTRYPSLSIGARARLAIFKREAAKPNWSHPLTWRDVRFSTLESRTGIMGGGPEWYTHDGEQFRGEHFSRDLLPRMRHTGWYGDSEHQEKLIRGFVARLSHGRFIAGILCDDNDERIYFSGIYTDEHEAAQQADEHARIYAEKEDEYSQRFNEGTKLEGLIEEKLSDVDTAFALRNHPRLGAVNREHCREIIADIKAFRRELKNLNL